MNKRAEEYLLRMEANDSCGKLTVHHARRYGNLCILPYQSALEAIIEEDGGETKTAEGILDNIYKITNEILDR